VNVSLYQASAAMDATSRWQDLISQNLAATSIPGYKRQELSFSAVAGGILPAPLNGSAQHFALPTVGIVTNFAPGEMKYTGGATDVALDGPGFLEVQLANGDKAYTRDGELQFNSQGQLVTKQGDVVLTDGGPVQIDPRNHAPLTISATGAVSQGSDQKGQLRLVEFAAPQRLVQAGRGYYLATEAAQPTDATATRVKQGNLELANSSPMAEMANMLQALRQYEANQRVVQIQDERLGRTISELGPQS
jgi:flagellar basal-body rod protein FlgF